MLLPAFFADAVPGAGKAVREGAEGLSKKIARETAESASASMSRQIERLALRHGGEVRPLLRRLGPDAVEVAARYGDDGIRLMGRYGNDGAAALARSGDEILPLVHRHGDEVLGAAIRHPGVGERLVAEFGADGIRLSRRLSTDEAVTLLRRSGPAATAAPARSGRVVEFAKRHPEWIAGGAAAGVLVVHPEWFRSILGNLGHGLGSGIHSFAEGLFGERAAGWVIAGLVFLLFALAVIVLAGPRFLKVWLRSRRVPSF